MKYRLDAQYETIHEMDDGEPGSVMGFLIEGHVDYQLVEEFLACGEVEDYGFDDIQDWDVEWTYVRAFPIVDDDGNKTDSWEFGYVSEPKEGYRPVTKIETAWITTRWCAFHPMEPYDQSIRADNFGNETVRCVLPETTVSSAWGVEIPYIHLCKACADEYQIRWREAYDQAVIEIAYEDRLAEVVSR